MSQAANFPLERSATPATGPGIIAIVIGGAFGLVLWVTVGFQTFFIIPRFEKVFTEFRMKLPYMTEYVIRDTWWLAPVLLVGVLLLCVSARTRWAGIILLIVVPLIINLVIVAGLYFPYVALAEGLGGNAPKW